MVKFGPKNKFLYFCLLFLIISISFWSLYFFKNVTAEKDLVVLRSPIVLEKNRTYKIPFSTKINSVFNIEIYFEQKLPLEDMDCLLEIANYHPGGCKKYKKGLVDISWKILDGAIVVASRDHATKGNGFWGGNIVGKELGEFTNNRSGLKKYILKATVERSAPELAITNPCLKISAEIKTWEAVRVEAFGFFLLAIIFSIISLVFLVIWTQR